MNPLSLLTDLLPAKARRYVYAFAAAALFIYGLWEVSAGDVKAFVVSVASALVATLAAANTPAPRAEVEEAAVDLLEDEDPGLYFDGHGDEV